MDGSNGIIINLRFKSIQIYLEMNRFDVFLKRRLGWEGRLLCRFIAKGADLHFNVQEVRQSCIKLVYFILNRASERDSENDINNRGNKKSSYSDCIARPSGKTISFRLLHEDRMFWRSSRLSSDTFWKLFTSAWPREIWWMSARCLCKRDLE